MLKDKSGKEQGVDISGRVWYNLNYISDYDPTDEYAPTYELKVSLGSKEMAQELAYQLGVSQKTSGLDCEVYFDRLIDSITDAIYEGLNIEEFEEDIDSLGLEFRGIFDYTNKAVDVNVSSYGDLEISGSVLPEKCSWEEFVEKYKEANGE